MGALIHCSLLMFIIICCLHGSFGKQKACFDYFCFCEGTLANCSNNGKGLQYVPLPNIERIETYYFEFNYLPNINKATFKNIHNKAIKFLSLRGNQITNISRKSFHGLIHLETLYLSDNLIDPNFLKEAFINTIHLLVLQLNNMGLTHLPNDMFEGMQHGVIERIYLAHNNLTYFNQSVVRKLKYVTTLDLTANEISSLELMPSATLGNLLLGFNRLDEIPNLCPNGSSLYPRLWTLNLMNNNISSLNVSNIHCLDFLRNLSLSRNRLQFIPTRAFSNMSKLDILEIANNDRAHLTINHFAFNGSKFSYLNLSSSAPWFQSRHAFDDCPNLKNLDMSYTNFKNVNFLVNGLLGKLNLVSFFCRNCGLNRLPVPLKSMTALEFLFLDGNFITVIPNHVFDSNVRLNHLSLSRNNISTVTGFDISYSVRYNLQYINLGDNPFICDCRLLWLKDWINSKRAMFFGQFMNYKCAKPPEVEGLQILDVGIVSDKRCLMHSPFTYVMCLVGTAFVCLLLLALAYKCRYKICFCFIRRRPKYTSETRPLLQNDAYVVYCDENYHPWVRRELMPNMEELRCLRLGIRQRDFDQSRHKVSNIVESLRCCRKVLVVLSNSFFRDSDSQDELSLVLKCIEDQRGVLVVVLLEDIDDRYMSRPLYRLLQRITQVQWPLEPSRRRQFWEDLKTSLTDTMLHSFS